MHGRTSVQHFTLNLLTWMLAVSFGWPIAAALAAAQVRIHQGARQPSSGKDLEIWANSPQTSLTLYNPDERFLRTDVRWLNVPEGSYLATPQGVADATSVAGCTLKVRSLLAAHGTAHWQLESNIKGDYAFAVTSGALSGLNRTNSP